MSNKLLLCSPDEYDVTNQNTHLSFTGTLQLPDHITQIDKLVYSHCHAALLSVGQVILPTIIIAGCVNVHMIIFEVNHVTGMDDASEIF